MATTPTDIAPLIKGSPVPDLPEFDKAFGDIDANFKSANTDITTNETSITSAETRLDTLEGYSHITGSYDTGWINRTDWTNVYMGTNTSLNTDSNVTHGLAANLSSLIVKVLISTDGTDNNSFEIVTVALDGVGSFSTGISVFQVDTNNLRIQTGAQGIYYIRASDGLAPLISSPTDMYYKIVVYGIA